MKRLLLIGLMFFALGAEEMPPTEIPPEEPIEIPTEIPIEEPIEIPPEVIPEITPEPTEEVIPEIPPEPTPEPAIITGCTDPIAANYIPPGGGYVVKGDNSCIYFMGCMDKRAMNYADAAVKDNGSCMYMTGCTDPCAVNYVDTGFYTVDDGSCYYSEWYAPCVKQEEPEPEPEAVFAEPEPVYIYEDYSDMIEASME